MILMFRNLHFELDFACWAAYYSDAVPLGTVAAAVEAFVAASGADSASLVVLKTFLKF